MNFVTDCTAISAPKQERSLIERRGEGVVHSENRAMFSRRGTDRVDVAGTELNPACRVLDCEAADSPAASVLSRQREPGHALIAIMGEADDGSDRELIKDRGDGRHPGGGGEGD